MVARDAAGNPDPTGSIVMISVGMCNTSMEFAPFETAAMMDPSVSPAVVVINGAQGGAPADDWASPMAMTWSIVDNRLSMAGVTPEQVQVAWIKQAMAGPLGLGVFPMHAAVLQANLEDIARALRTRYPQHPPGLLLQPHPGPTPTTP